jgi:catechol 2,3-dioxygenase-like lactoylglutathione lyase family enzyme
MLDHISLGVTDLARARKFYDAVLRPLGYRMVLPIAGHAYGYGAAKDQPRFWIGLPLAKRRKARAGAGTHIAFEAPTRKAVNAFYKAALRAGAKDNGKPGLRADYHPNYYGAFVFDPEGHAIEAVCHKPE